MKSASKQYVICRVTNAINSLIIIVSLLVAGFVYFFFDVLGLIFAKAGDTITSASADSIVGGYQVLGGLGLGILGILGVIAIVAVVAVCLFIAIILIPSVICGRVSHRRYKKNGYGSFKGDSIYKIIADGFLAFACFSSVDSEQLWIIAVAILPVTVVVLSIISLFDKSTN